MKEAKWLENAVKEITVRTVSLRVFFFFAAVYSIGKVSVGPIQLEIIPVVVALCD